MPSTELTPELVALIDQIARATRLSRRARDEVRTDLSEHVRAWLEEGVPPEAIPGRLGNPTLRGREIRRGRIARRPLPLRLVPSLRHGLLAVLLAPFLFYGVLLARFHFSHPQITRNFAAELNAALPQVPPESRAEPLYLQAVQLLESPPSGVSTTWPEFQPGTPDGDAAVAYIKKSEGALDFIRRGAALPALGHVLTDGSDPRWGDTRERRATAAEPPTANPFLIGIGLPYLGTMRSFARLLAADAHDAAASGDGARIEADFSALLGLTRQTRESPFLITDLVSIAVFQLAVNHLGALIERYPGALSGAQLATLARGFGSFGDADLRARYTGERMFFEDLLQRTYTDNGSGDGRLCADGVRLLRSISGSTDANGTARPPIDSDAFLGPIAALASPSRKQAMDTYEHFMGLSEKETRTPRWLRAPSTLDAQVAALGSQLSFGYDPVPILLPALGKAMQSGDDAIQSREGILTVIALERYRLAHGAYPKALSELVPEFLQALPLDRYDGSPIRYKLVAEKPIVYCIGIDLKDDGGVPPPGKGGNLKARFRHASGGGVATGDYIFWPEPKDPPETPE